MLRRIVFPLLFSTAVMAAGPLYASQLTLSVGDISTPSFSARGVALSLPLDGSAVLGIDELSAGGKHWRKLRVHCAGFDLSTVRLVCRRAKLNTASDLPFDFSWNFYSKRLALDLSARGGERWRVSGDFHGRDWRMAAQLQHAQARRLALLLPGGMPLPTQGQLDGTLQLQGNAAGLHTIRADVGSAGLAFSDASGLHAADKLAAALQFEAVRRGAGWDWHGALDWRGGELYWQPLYLKGAHRLTASGQWDGRRLQLAQAVVSQPQVGQVELSGAWDSASNSLLECTLRGSKLQLAPLFADYFKPFLGDSVLAASALSGQGDVVWQYRDGATQALDLTLRDASLEDGQHRFALRGVNATIPWRADAAAQAQVAFDSGALWGVPLGAAQLQVAMQGLQFSLSRATLPVIDGKLTARDFLLRRAGGEWSWAFSGWLTPVSMQSLSRALGWPEMHGEFSGRIPRVSYADHRLTTDGALLFRVFDGTVVMTRLALVDPFGPTPQLSGDLDMRDLDLGLLTRTFSFGNMEGRIDVSVKNLELVNWQPVQFDARLASSPGDYRKRISQKAVQNISSLGGAGAAAAIQRSYLSFLKDFGYSRIGLSCVLRAGVCAMDGVADRNGGYVIVEGGGIPAITVMGYNHAVGWDELLSRLKRVLQDNTQMVIQ